MSVPLPNSITGIQAIRSSEQAIAIHSISERLVPEGPKASQGSQITAATAYLAIPRALQNQSMIPIAFNPMTGRYLPDRVNDILNKASVRIKYFKESVGVDLSPMFPSQVDGER